MVSDLIDIYPGSISLSTGEALGNAIRGDIVVGGGDIRALAHNGGDVDLYSGSSDDSKEDAGIVSIVTGSSHGGGGHINIIASSNVIERRHWMQHLRREISPKEINFGFDDYSPLGLEERKVRDAQGALIRIPPLVLYFFISALYL